MRHVKMVTTMRAIVAMLLIGTMVHQTHAFAHLWGISEIFSNADGTIQFIEMVNGSGSGCSGENLLSGEEFTTTTNTYIFPSPNVLSSDTCNKKFLMATVGFQALPGAPAPDYIIPDNFFDPSGDTLEFVSGFQETASFGPGELPTDGINSIDDSLVVGMNSPTNFAGASGSIDVSDPSCDGAGDLDTSCMVDLGDFVLFNGQWMTVGCNAENNWCAGADMAPPGEPDGTVNLADLLELVLHWLAVS